MEMPHYNTFSMPAISLHTALHIIQWCRTGRFLLYDYGSAAENMRHYGTPTPTDIAADYHLLDMPIDVMAGSDDGIIAADNVRMHYERMKAAGCRVSLKIFNGLGHLDFVFGGSDDLRYYTLGRIAERCT